MSERDEREKALANALERLIAATYLPETCAHDSEPDICDGCQYAMEKGIRDARIHARAALAHLAPDGTGETPP